MPVFRVRILGQGFMRDLDGTRGELAFLTNQFVEAPDAASAEGEAIHRVRAREDLASELSRSSMWATVTVEETVELDEPMPAAPAEGLTWFPMHLSGDSSH